MMRYAFCLIIVIMFCLTLLAGCQATPADGPEPITKPEPVSEPEQPAEPESAHIETLAIELPGTAITADFIVPDSLRWEIFDVLHVTG